MCTRHTFLIDDTVHPVYNCPCHHTGTPAMPSSFTPAGLTDYTVRFADNAWWVDVHAGATVSFGWNPATEQHDVPHTYDRSFCIEKRATAKQAVAAAHHHKRWVENYNPATHGK